MVFEIYDKPPDGSNYEIYAVVEWFPDPLVALDEKEADGKTRILNIKPGDWIEVVLEADTIAARPMKATISITNINRGERATRELQAPRPETALTGKSVEWIVELIAPSKLPSFGELHFKDCSANTIGNGGAGVKGHTVDSTGADHITMKQNSLLMTDIRIDSANAFTVKYRPRKA